MKSIRLRNIRSLADTGYISLKPITLFLGQNSSGKSTVLRTLPLLLQSLRTRSNAPVLWYGDLVDFGSVREVRSTFASDQAVQIELDLGQIEFTRRGLVHDQPPAANSPTISIGIQLIDADGKTRLKGFSLTVENDTFNAELDARGAVTSLTINHIEMSKLLPADRYRFSITEIVPQLLSGKLPVSPRSNFYSPYRRGVETCEREIRRFFTEKLHRRISDETLNSMIRRVAYKPGISFIDELREGTSALRSGQKLVASLEAEKGHGDLNRLRSLYLLWALPDILIAVERHVTRTIGSVSYVGPSRATGERYYRLQELAVDQIDPQGRNLAMFLHSLTATQQRQFSEWLLEAMGYAIQIEKSAGHIQIHLREENSAKFYNIADMGYGFSQVLPIMAQVWSRQTRASGRGNAVMVAMEQPELHLHPAYQARLANVFCRSIARQRKNERFSGELRFIIETHSEALINRLGNLVYEKQISADDIAIYIFEKAADREITDIRTVRFDQDGTLTNWPIGFFSAAQ